MNSALRYAQTADTAAQPSSAGLPTTTSTTLLLDKQQLAAELRCSTRKIDRLDSAGKLPAPVRIGVAKRWARQTIEKWIAAGCPERLGFEKLTR